MPFVMAAVAFSACSKSADSQASNINNNDDMKEQTADTTSVRVAVSTTAGDFTVLLYGDTPKHRDNFVRLVKESYYDSTLFHRVIKEFMIQAGDPDSKTAKPGQMLGAGGPDYKIDAEIVFPRHFHKRGVLAAARQGDQVNPKKQSSGSQFYIVTGRVLSDAEMAAMNAQMVNKQKQSIFSRLAGERRQQIIELQRNGDHAGLQALQDELIKLVEAEVAAMPAPSVTPEMREAYTTVGGAPHLDGDYTVFGEVVDGMEVIDAIEKVATDRSDRPVEDVRVLSMKLLD